MLRTIWMNPFTLIGWENKVISKSGVKLVNVLMNRLCGFSFRKEKQSSALWSIWMFSRGIKYSQTSVVLLRFSGILLVVSPGWLQSMEPASSWQSVSSSSFHPNLKESPLPSLKSLSPASYCIFFWALFIVQNSAMIWTIENRLASNLVIITWNQWKWNSHLEHFQWEITFIIQALHLSERKC